MANYIVAVVGRPNVGKSTFVNRITQADDAIVHEMRGVTRDRSYHEADWNGVSFTLIDTGGIEMGGDDAFQASITSQAFSAADECDLIIFWSTEKQALTPTTKKLLVFYAKRKPPWSLRLTKWTTPRITTLSTSFTT